MTQFPSPYSAAGSDDQQWRRPEPGSGPVEVPASAAASQMPGYSGPPATVPVPPDWHPPTVVTIPAPRQLPAQDASAIESVERRALATTHGVGLIAGAIALLVLIVLCGRVIF